MTRKLADPIPCVRQARDGKGRCEIMRGRNEAKVSITRVVYSEETTRRGGRVQRWSFGHVAAVRDKHGIRLEVGNAGTTQAHSSAAVLPEQARHAADCLRAAAVNAEDMTCAGKSLYEMVWDELMTVMERLMCDGEAEDGRDPGRAEGLAMALAIFTNPYYVDIEQIRKAAMERWLAENPDWEDDSE